MEAHSEVIDNSVVFVEADDLALGGRHGADHGVPSIGIK
jgi:hypothetical protein